MRPALTLLVVLLGIAVALHLSRTSSTSNAPLALTLQPASPVITLPGDVSGSALTAAAHQMGADWVHSVINEIANRHLRATTYTSTAPSSLSEGSQHRIMQDQVEASAAAAYFRIIQNLLPHMVPPSLLAGERHHTASFAIVLCAEHMLAAELSRCPTSTNQSSQSSACRWQQKDDTNIDCQVIQQLAGQNCPLMLPNYKRVSDTVLEQHIAQRGEGSRQSSTTREEEGNVDFSSSTCSMRPQQGGVGGYTREELLLLVLVDLRMSQLHLVPMLFGSTNLGTDARAAPASTTGGVEAARNDVIVGLLCLAPKVRASIAFALSNGWMFRAGRLRFLWSLDDMVDAKEQQYRQPTPLAASFSFNFANKHASSRSSARSKAIYFNITNIVIPAVRGTSPSLQGYGVGGKKKLDRIRDERFINIRKLYIHERSASSPVPRFSIRKQRPLYLFPVIFGSDNVGHVMFRYYSALDLWRHEMVPMSHGGTDSPLVAYVVMPTSEATFTERSNMHRIFFDALSPRWFSLMSSTVSTAPSDRLSALDVSFDHTIAGFGRTYMFHPRHIGDLDRVRKESQAALVPALAEVRMKLLDCFGWWSGANISAYHQSHPHTLDAATAGAAPTLTSVRVTVILRRSRQLVGIEDHIEAFLRNSSEMDSSDVKLALRGRSGISIRQVRLETLTIREQVALAMRSDVWFGAAGTGLSWMMFMRPSTTVVEVQDPPIMRCTGVGINTERTYCDFSKQSSAAQLNHIGVPVPKHNAHECAKNSLRCDLSMTFPVFRGALLASVCASGIADEGAARGMCTEFLVAA